MGKKAKFFKKAASYAGVAAVAVGVTLYGTKKEIRVAVNSRVKKTANWFGKNKELKTECHQNQQAYNNQQAHQSGQQRLKTQHYHNQ